MRKYLVGSSLALLLIIGGCWAASNRGIDVGEPVEDGLRISDLQIDEELEVVPDWGPPLARVDGEHFEAFDLLRNRPLAHRITTTPEGKSFWIDASRPDFTRYIQGNQRNDWLTFAEVEGGIVAGTRGREATLTLPAAPAESTEVLQMRIFNPARHQNSLTVTINGEALAPVDLDEGWQTVEYDLHQAPVRADNDLALSFSNLGRIQGSLSGGGIAWARIGPYVEVEVESVDVESPEGQDEDSVEADEYVEAELDEDIDEAPAPLVAIPEPHQLLYGQGSVTLSAEEGLSWPLWIHDDAVLELEMAGDYDCGPSVEVIVEAGAGAVETVYEEQIRLVEGHGQVQITSFGLPVDSNQVARLDISVAPDLDCEGVELSRARLIRPGVIAGVPEEIEPPRYVIFWIIDTLRADYLPIHFETDVQAPNLERLASEGVSFEIAYVQGTESRTSHASLFTGLYPERHGVMARGRVDRNLPILPNFFQDMDYRTYLNASNGYVSHLLNLNRGWDHYQNNIHDETGLDARTMANAGLRWMQSQEDNPLFIYLGTIDPHVTYRRHEGIIDIYEPEPYHGRFRRFLSGQDLGLIKGRQMQVTEREKERIINLYKNEITFNDQAFGELRESLEEMGIWEDTLIVITSDHGEEFWEHGSVGHGHNVHQEMVHVPLIFHYPRGLPAGRSVRSGAEVIDVLPTVIDLLGGEALTDRQGMSLLPYIFGEHGGYPAPALATQYLLHYGLQIDDWKIYIRGSNLRLYDRRTDPLELEDVRADHPLASRWLQDSLGWFRAYREEWEKSTWGVANNVSDRFLEFIVPDDRTE